MQALVLKKKGTIVLEDFSVEETLGADDVRVDIRRVGICGSDLHYYLHGNIGSHVVSEPMILGHEASGVVSELGSNVEHLAVGDRVCMEPGVPDPAGRATKLGMYHVDPSVRFWATPPVHGCLRESVVHPAAFTFKVPDRISLSEAAMVEPAAVAMHAATKAGIRPGDVAVVIGAGTIGLLTACAALAGGCSKVIISDVLQPKLDFAATLGALCPVHAAKEDLKSVVIDTTEGWGADIVFEASGNPTAAQKLFEYVAPGGRVVLIGMPAGPISFDVHAAQVKEALVIPIFRYAHMYPRTLSLIASGALDVKGFISKTFPFGQAVEAFDRATEQRPEDIKIQISCKEA